MSRKRFGSGIFSSIYSRKFSVVIPEAISMMLSLILDMWIWINFMGLFLYLVVFGFENFWESVYLRVSLGLVACRHEVCYLH